MPYGFPWCILDMSCVVVKIGGSLFDLPELGPVLRAYLAALPYTRILLVPGGGASADVVRDLDAIHRLGEAGAHEIALTSLSVSNHFLRTLLDIETEPRGDWYAAPERLHVLPPGMILEPYEARFGAVPRSWNFTSDSLAACAAIVAACGLIVLKSTDADAENLVDRCFASFSVVRVEFVNFRRVVALESTRRSEA